MRRDRLLVSRLVGPFYPPGTRRQEMFAQYVRQFRTVELNYTFYRMPAARTLERLAQASPPDLPGLRLARQTSLAGEAESFQPFRAECRPLAGLRHIGGQADAVRAARKDV